MLFHVRLFLGSRQHRNAKIQGMTKEPHMRGNDDNIAVMLFTVAYIIFGLPASLIFKKRGPQSLSVMMFLRGIALRLRARADRTCELISHRRSMRCWRGVGQNLRATPSATLPNGHVRVWLRPWLCLPDQFLLHRGRVSGKVLSVLQHGYPGGSFQRCEYSKVEAQLPSHY